MRLKPLFMVAVTTLVACGGGGGATSASPNTSTPQSLNVTLYPGSLISYPLYVADKQGFFKKYNVNVSQINVNGGPAATAAVLSGSADIELNSSDNNMLARQQGQNLVCVVNNTQHSVFSIVVRNDWPLPHLSGGYPTVMQDLKGLRFGITARGASAEIIPRQMFKNAGLDPDKEVTWIAVGVIPTALPALQNKQIDGYMGFEPFQTKAVDQLKIGKIVVDLRTPQKDKFLQLFDWDYNSWCALKQNVDSKKEAFRRFEAAMKDAFAWVSNSSNFNAAVDVAASSLGVDQATAQVMLKNNLPTLTPNFDATKIKNASDYMMMTGQIKKSIDIKQYVYQV